MHTAPTTGLLDSLDRANAASLGASFVDTYGGHSLSSNGAVAESAGGDVTIWNIAFNADHEAHSVIERIPGIGEACGHLLRCSDPASIMTARGYWPRVLNDATLGFVSQIVRLDVGGVVTLIGSTVAMPGFSPDSKLLSRVVGNRISSFYQLKTGGWVRGASEVDPSSTYMTGGYAGFFSFGTNSKYANLSGGSYVPSGLRGIVPSGSLVCKMTIPNNSAYDNVTGFVLEFGLTDPRYSYGTTQYIIDSDDIRIRIDASTQTITYFDWRGTSGSTVTHSIVGMTTARLSCNDTAPLVCTFEVFNAYTGERRVGTLPTNAAGARNFSGDWFFFGAAYGSADTFQAASMNFARLRISSGAAAVGHIPSDYTTETWNVFNFNFANNLNDSSGNNFHLSVQAGTAAYADTPHQPVLINVGGDYGLDDWGQSNVGFDGYTLIPGVSKQLDFRRTFSNHSAKTFLLEQVAGGTTVSITNSTSAQPTVTAGTPSGDTDQATMKLTVGDSLLTVSRIFHVGIVKKDATTGYVVQSDATLRKLIGELQPFGALDTLTSSQALLHDTAKKRHLMDWGRKIPNVAPYGGRPGGLDPLAVIPGTLTVTNGSRFAQYSGSNLRQWIEAPDSICTNGNFKANINVENAGSTIYRKIAVLTDTTIEFETPWTGTSGSGRRFYTPSTGGDDIQNYYRYRLAEEILELHRQTGLEIYRDEFNRVTNSLWTTLQWFYGIPQQGEISPVYQDDVYSLLIRAYIDRPAWWDCLRRVIIDVRFDIRVYPTRSSGVAPGPLLPSGLDGREIGWMCEGYELLPYLMPSTYDEYDNGTHNPPTATGIAYSTATRNAEIAKSEVDVLDGVFERLMYVDGSYRWDATEGWFGICQPYQIAIIGHYFLAIIKFTANSTVRAKAWTLLGRMLAMLRANYTSHSAGAAFGGITWRTHNYSIFGYREWPPGSTQYFYSSAMGDAGELYQGDSSVRLNRNMTQMQLALFAAYAKEFQHAPSLNFALEIIGASLGDATDTVLQTTFSDQSVGQQKMATETFYSFDEGVALAFNTVIAAYRDWMHQQTAMVSGQPFGGMENYY